LVSFSLGVAHICSSPHPPADTKNHTYFFGSALAGLKDLTKKNTKAEREREREREREGEMATVSQVTIGSLSSWDILIKELNSYPLHSASAEKPPVAPASNQYITYTWKKRQCRGNLPVCLPDCLPACLPVCLPTCLSISLQNGNWSGCRRRRNREREKIG